MEFWSFKPGMGKLNSVGEWLSFRLCSRHWILSNTKTVKNILEYFYLKNHEWLLFFSVP